MECNYSGSQTWQHNTSRSMYLLDNQPALIKKVVENTDLQIKLDTDYKALILRRLWKCYDDQEYMKNKMIRYVHNRSTV